MYIIRRQPNKWIFIGDFKCTALKNNYSAAEVNSYLIGNADKDFKRPSEFNCTIIYILCISLYDSILSNLWQTFHTV